MLSTRRPASQPTSPIFLMWLPDCAFERTRDRREGGHQPDILRPQAAALGFASQETLVDIARDLRFKLADHGVRPEDLQYSGHGYANLLFMATIAVELEKVRK